MDTFYMITKWIALLMGITIFIGFILHIHKNRNNSRTLLRSFGAVLILIALVVIPYKLVNHFGNEHSYYSFSESSTINIDTDTLSKIGPTGIDSLDFHYHFRKVQSFKEWMDNDMNRVNRTMDYYYDLPWSKHIRETYLDYQNSKDSNVRDVGYLFSALHEANLQGSARRNQRLLNKITTTEIPFYNYVQGLNDFNQRDWAYKETAEKHLLLSINENEAVLESYGDLAYLYWYFHEDAKLDQLIYSEETTEMVPIWIRGQIYFMDFNWKDYWEMWFSYELNFWGLLNVSAAAFLLLLWVFFLRKLDIYEPEKWKYVLATFCLSVISMQLLYPMYNFQWGILEYYRPNDPVSDFAYMVISIGMKEELVKIIPMLIMLKFTKAINEPFDFIFYAAISALGFAFVENIQYYHYSPHSVSLRAFYCYIGHMTFTATIGYGLMLARYRGYHSRTMFVLFFLIASFMHGFYDFWLLDWWGLEFQWVSDISVIIFIQLFVYFTNNTLNISNFYNPSVLFRKERLKFYGIAICILILMTGYTVSSITYGKSTGKDLLVINTYQLSFFMFFFVLSLHAMKQIRGYLRPLTLPLQGIFPEEKMLKNISGLELKLSISGKHPIKDELLKKMGSLQQFVQLKSRLVVDDNLEGYIAQLSSPIELESGLFTNQIIMIPHWDKKRFNSKKRVLANIYLMKSDDILQEPLVQETDLIYLGRVFSEVIG
jgi:RsiW-degrading membrane proteinase PrsW (M82 family)